MNLIDFIHAKNLETSKEIVFFGGSFNPWHEGHSNCVKLAPKDRPLIVMPDHNPFKEMVNSDQKLTSIQQVESILQSIRPNAFLFEGFSEANQKNPTSNWVVELSQKTSLKISLLLGFDSFMTIDKWINAQELLDHLHALYIVSRVDNEELKQKQIDKLKSLKMNSIHFMGHHDSEHLSSAKLRAAQGDTE